MNIVGTNKSTGEVFESQSYKTDAEKEVIRLAIQTDSEGSGIEVEISEMTDEELRAIISS